MIKTRSASSAGRLPNGVLLRNAVVAGAVAALAITLVGSRSASAAQAGDGSPSPSWKQGGDKLDRDLWRHAAELLTNGKRVFRHDTFGDEAFWGGTLRLHEAIAGAANGGVGPGLSPATALAVGLKVDVDALPDNLIRRLKKG